ncbi:hypothetical protein XM25_03925 [Devosia sp. H5989]|nr:hypothetical protein XM25_03925 [Devosia sp. H5989]
MITRRRGPSLVGRTAQTVARTAVIAGTATAVSGKVAARQAGGSSAPAAGAPPATPEPAAPAGLSQEAMAQLEKLADLHKSGILTDEEFAAQKARILQ